MSWHNRDGGWYNREGDPPQRSRFHGMKWRYTYDADTNILRRERRWFGGGGKWEEVPCRARPTEGYRRLGDVLSSLFSAGRAKGRLREGQLEARQPKAAE